MNHSQQQDKDDLEVFQEFVHSEGGPGWCWDSVVHGDEHKAVPDVVCRLTDVVTYYELTQVDPRELHRLIARGQLDHNILATYLPNKTEWNQFQRDYQAYAFDLDEPPGGMRLHSAVHRVLRYLLRHDPKLDYPQNVDGGIHIPYEDITSNGEPDIAGYRFSQHQTYEDLCMLPGVNLFPWPSLGDPQVLSWTYASRNQAISPIDTKCKKQYREESGREPLCPECVHLVLWTDISGFLKETTEYLESSIGRSVWESAFSSVWLFDRVHQRIICHVLGPSSSEIRPVTP